MPQALNLAPSILDPSSRRLGSRAPVFEALNLCSKGEELRNLPQPGSS